MPTNDHQPAGGAEHQVAHSSLARLFFGDVPLAVADSLRLEPYRWRTDSSRNSQLKITYNLEHDSGVILWVANRTYGMEVQAPRAEKWGDATFLSSIYLSPGHHLLRAAANRWLRTYGDRPMLKASSLIPHPIHASDPKVWSLEMTAPPIVPADLQPGDAVTIYAQVRRAPVDVRGDEGYFVDVDVFNFKDATIRLPIESIATHTPKPRPLAPGDKVWIADPMNRMALSRIKARIIAIDGELAWVRWNENKGCALVRNDVIGVTFLERAQ